MTIINTRMNVKNGTAYDTHHLETNEEMVLVDGGKTTLKEKLAVINKFQTYRLTENDGQIKYITTDGLDIFQLAPGNYACIASRFTNPPIPNDGGYVDIIVRQNTNGSGTRKVIIVNYIYTERIFIAQKHNSYLYTEWKEIDFKSPGTNYSQLFYEQEVEDLYEKLLPIQNENTKSIGFITDTHYIRNTRGVYGMNALRHIDQIINFGNGMLDMIVHGGDIINGKGNNHKLITELMDVNKHALQSNVPMYLCKGNHDTGSWKIDNQEDKNYDRNIISQNKWNRLITKKYENKYGFKGDINNNSNNYGYYDFSDVKLRVIMLDTQDYVKEHIVDDSGNVITHTGSCSISQMQLDWLVQQALVFPEKSGWNVIVFGHNAMYKAHDINSASPTRNGYLVHNVLKAFKGQTTYSATSSSVPYGASVNCDFTGTNHNVVAMINGHYHKDAIDLKDFQYIECSSSAPNLDEFAEEDVPTRGMGTATEDSWTIFTVNTATRKIYINRFGYGKEFEQTISF